MEVILLKRVDNLGDIGDLVKVRSGYGRNFLIPHGQAKPATPENIAEIEAMRAELERQATETLEAARTRAAQFEALGILRITQKAGSEGKLFGSVGTQTIADACTAAGVPVERKEVLLTEGSTIRTVGEHEVHVRLHSDIEVTLKVDVIGEEGGEPMIIEEAFADDEDAPTVSTEESSTEETPSEKT